MSRRVVLIGFVCAFVASFSFCDRAVPTAHAQAKRHIFVEEFTGSWCGFCVRGNYAIRVAEAKYPGEIAFVSYHDARGQGLDPMSTLQGDSLLAGLGGLPLFNVNSVPNSYVARTCIPGYHGPSPDNLHVQVDDWVHPLKGYNETTTPGIIDSMLAHNVAKATIAIDNLTFDPASHMASARLTATFLEKMTGDFRLNIMVTQDSLSGPAGSLYDQINYYSSSDASVGGQLPQNPYYNYPYKNPGWQHRYVFMEAVGGIWGAPGLIPESPAVGTPYISTFNFRLPDSVTDPNGVRLVALVQEYSATDSLKNEVFDAAVTHLSTTKIPVVTNPISVTSDSGEFITTKSNGTKDFTLHLQNNGSSDKVNVTLSVDASNPLPVGWSATVSPSTITLDPGVSGTATLHVTAPDQSNFVNVGIIAFPQESGVFGRTARAPIYALSDNTRTGVYFTPGFGMSASIANSLPASISQHAAPIPLVADAIYAWPIEYMDLAIFDNDPVMGGSYSYPANSVSAIQTLLSTGKKVLFTSDEALSAQYNTNDANYANAHSDDAQSFLEDGLGVLYHNTVNHTNSSTGAYVSFGMKGTSDPIGAGISATMLGSSFASNVAISSGSNSIPLFYYDNVASHVAGFRYTDPLSGGRLVFLGFNLNSVKDTAMASGIASRSIDWLLGLSGVADEKVAPTTGFSVTENPFADRAELQFIPQAGERDITYSVLDILGREVTSLSPRSDGEGRYRLTFDATGLADGVYIVQARSQIGTHEVRIIHKH